MAYKVTFETLAITGENEKTGKPIIGNVTMGVHTIFTDLPISAIEGAISADFEGKKVVPVIKSIEYINGKCLN